jgi:hypothetical protein
MDTIGKIVLGFSVLGICTLFGVSLLVEPPFVPLDEVMRYEGAVVRTRGALTDFTVTSTGNVLLKLEENHTELLVFLDVPGTSEELETVSYGDELEVEGQVQLYRGAYELVSSQTAIKKVEQGPYPVVFVAQVAVQPERYEGKRIRVAGYAEDVYSHVFYLRDETKTYQMRVKLVTPELSLSDLQDGDRMIAEGVFSYDAPSMRYELQLLQIEVLP